MKEKKSCMCVIHGSHIIFIFPILLHTCAPISKLPSNIGMGSHKKFF